MKWKALARRQRNKWKEFGAAPKWRNDFMIEEAYHLAQLRRELTGLKWSVDHLVPRWSNNVCGLHVEFNVRVILAWDNLSKKNYWWPGMTSDKTETRDFTIY